MYCSLHCPSYAGCSTFPSLLAYFLLTGITPIPEGTNSSLPSGYRPISVLPIASKLIERHVKLIIEDHLRENSPISTKQWDLMSSHSMVSALIRVIDDWLCALDQGYEVTYLKLLIPYYIWPSSQNYLNLGWIHTS